MEGAVRVRTIMKEMGDIYSRRGLRGERSSNNFIRKLQFRLFLEKSVNGHHGVFNFFLPGNVYEYVYICMGVYSLIVYWRYRRLI